MKWRRREVGGQLVTLRDVRLWMASVPAYAGREGSDRWWFWVEDYRVPAKIAAELRAGTFHRTCLRGLVEKGRSDHRSLRWLKVVATAVAERGQPSA